ncbi:uncharacterized protein [Watersipora subatra]|uniref:uncharacterized protein n=1 Tax=Watersipora subatra TaxID=2589382 RepID=UPI00355B4E35
MVVTGLKVQALTRTHKSLLIFLLGFSIALYFIYPSIPTTKGIIKAGKQRYSRGGGIGAYVSGGMAKSVETEPVGKSGFDGTTMPSKVLATDSKSLRCQHFHLLTIFFSVQSQKQYTNFSLNQLEGRNREYLKVLQSNLNHACVHKIHLFYVREDDLKLILAANLSDSHKLAPVKYKQLLHMADFFLYASRNLVNKSVIALNSDIALGEGFELIDTKALLTQKHFYSLTRYETNISCSIGHQMCIGNYIGSHDTHVFALSKPLNETLLVEKLDYPINMYQAENGMIYTMKNHFGFKVSNPCRVLKTYHHHCSAVHGPPPGSNYTIYSLGWKAKEIRSGLAWPSVL